MDSSNLLLIAGVVLILVLAVIFNDKVKATFMGLGLRTNNTFKESKVEIKGDGNRVKQKTNREKESPSERHESKLEGNENEIEQG